MNAKQKIGLAAAGVAAAAIAGFGVVAAGSAAAETTPGTTVSAPAAPNADGTQNGTAGQPGQRGPGGQMGGHEHTAVTGDEAQKVTDAVKAKNSAAQVTSVEKDPDGSYDVHATVDGQPVMYEVSADLGTVTERAGGPGGGMGGQPPAGDHGPSDGTGTVPGGEATAGTDQVNG